MIHTYKEEARVLQNDRQLAAKLTKENKELQDKVNMMSIIQNTLKATAHEVEEMLKNHPDATTLAVMVASLKRELKAVDVKKNEFRDMWKLAQSDLTAANQKIKNLESKCSNLENDITKLEQKINMNKAVVYDSDDTLNKTPDVLRQTCSDDLNLSTPLADRVDRIVNANSPYMNIKGSNILSMCPKTKRPGLKPLAGGILQPATTISKTQSDLTDRVSKFKMPRPNFMEPGTSKNRKENLPVPMLRNLPAKDLKTKLRVDKLKYTKIPSIGRMEMTTMFSPIPRATGPDVIDLEMDISP